MTDRAQKPGDTGIDTSEYKKKEGAVAFRPPSEMKETSDMVVVRVRQAEHVVTREFRIQAVVDHPVVWQADEGQPHDWGYALRGQPEVPGITGTGAAFQFADITCGGKLRHGIFSRPPYQGGVGYIFGVFGPVVLPDDDCEFRAFVGLRDGGNPSDGVLFAVKVLDESGREHVVAEEFSGACEWTPISADLSAFRGENIRLKLITDFGLKDGSTSECASWGEPRIVLKDTVMRIGVTR